MTQRASIDPDKVRIVHNGIDLYRYAERDRPTIRKELEINDNQPIIGTVGNLYAIKGQTYLLRACVVVARAFHDFVLLVAGRGDQLGALEQEARGLGILGNVRFLGFREDIPCLLQAMDVLVLPSVSEGLPLSILEAMALGKPVVASNVGGIPEVVKDGMTGYLVPPKDPEALAQEILLLLHHPQLAVDFGKQGRKRVEEVFSLD